MKKIIIAITMVSCAVFAADLKSVQLGGTQVQGDDGRILAKYFNYVDTTTAMSNRVVDLCKIPANSRIVKGVVAVSAQGADQTFDVGLKGADNSGYISNDTNTADSVDMFLDGIACSNAVVDTFADLELGDSNANYVGFSREVLLTLKALGTTPWSTNATISGVVYYIEP